MGILATILSFVQSMVGKSVLIYGFGWLFKLNPKFKDEGIPVATAVVNILIAIIAAAAEASGVAAYPAGYAVISVLDPTPGGRGVDVVFDLVLPQLIADGLYNWPSKIAKWLKARLTK